MEKENNIECDGSGIIIFAIICFLIGILFILILYKSSNSITVKTDTLDGACRFILGDNNATYYSNNRFIISDRYMNCKTSNGDIVQLYQDKVNEVGY